MVRRITALCVAAAVVSASNNNNSVTFGNARVTVHTPQLIRLEWSATASFDDRPTMAFVNRSVSAPFASGIQGATLTLNTSSLNVSYTGSGRFGEDTLAISFLLRPGEPVLWTPGGPNTTQCGTVAGQDRVDCGVTSPTEATCTAVGCCFDPNVNGTNYDQHITHCYRPSVGGTGNLFGSVSSMDCDLGPLACIEWYKGQLNQGLVSRDGWVLVDDGANPALTSADFDNGTWPWRVERPWTSSYQDWYFFGHGHDYRAALRDFAAVSGPPALMDAHAYGVWHSRYHAYSDAEYTSVVETYAALNMSLHVAVLDMDWHTEPDAPGCDAYGGYTWNETLFPSPLNFTAWLRGRGMRSIINTHDVTGVDHCQGAAYAAMAAAMGVDPSSNATVACQLQDARYAAALFGLVKDPLHAGPLSAVDWTWTDWGKDYGVWYRCVADAGAQPMLWANYLHAQRLRAAGSRGLVLSPYGGLGNHRFPQVGSGDTDVSYSTLAFEVYSTLTAANVLTPWTHDLGGFHQTALLWPTPELWLRWVQFGVFSPSFRTHCTREGACEPWDFPLTAPQWIPAFQLRAALMPYIYSAAAAALASGVPVSFPAYYDWPEAPEAYAYDTQYLFGPHLLVAPVVEPQLVPRSPIWLPPGQWAEWCTNGSALRAGPGLLPQRVYGLDEIPVFVRGGAVLPLKPAAAPSAALPVAPPRLELVAFPGSGAAATAVYEDDGEGLAYAGDAAAYWLLNVTQDARTAATLGVTITPHAGGGGYAAEPPQRAFTVAFLLEAGAPPVGGAAVTVNGAPVPAAPPGVVPGWSASVPRGAYAALEVRLAPAPSGAAARVLVRLQ